MARGDLWLELASKEDPAAPEHDCDPEPKPRGMSFPHVHASKSAADHSRLRKLTSLTYLRGKLHGVFHRVHRDTIVCEEDEESPSGKRNIYDIIRRNEAAAQTSAGLALSKFGGAQSMSCDRYEPSKEQRWCTNCSKCFQRGLSHYDQYCGLDCKTAHRLRQSACSHAPHYLSNAGQSPSLVSEEALAARHAATQPVPHYTTYPTSHRGRMGRADRR